uniref:Uncharacterized protein n=1 Tax=Zea mays TaxID=4577 RepID=A0A804MIM4_MAIZE
MAGAAARPGAAERLGVQTPARPRPAMLFPARSGMEVGSSRCARGRAVELLLARPPSAFQPRSLVRPPLLSPVSPCRSRPPASFLNARSPTFARLPWLGRAGPWPWPSSPTLPPFYPEVEESRNRTVVRLTGSR